MILFATPFRLERDMIDPLLSALPTALSLAPGQEYTCAREAAVLDVIPDLLVALWKDEAAMSRWGSGRLTHLDYSVLAVLLQHGPVLPQRIAEILRVGVAALGRSIQSLQKSKLALFNSEGMLIACETNRFDHVEVIAIEAKLQRWSDALLQAATYRTFADRAFVVLDGNRVALTERMRRAFSDEGVGLLFQYGPIVQEQLAAAASIPISGERLLTISKLYRKRSQAIEAGSRGLPVGFAQPTKNKHPAMLADAGVP